MRYPSFHHSESLCALGMQEDADRRCDAAEHGPIPGQYGMLSNYYIHRHLADREYNHRSHCTSLYPSTYHYHTAVYLDLIRV